MFRSGTYQNCRKGNILISDFMWNFNWEMLSRVGLVLNFYTLPNKILYSLCFFQLHGSSSFCLWAGYYRHVLLKKDLHSLDLVWENHLMFSQVPLVVYNELLLKRCISTSSRQFCGFEVNPPDCPQVLLWIAELLLLCADQVVWVSCMQQKFVPSVCPCCQ